MQRLCSNNMENSCRALFQDTNPNICLDSVGTILVLFETICRLTEV